MYQYRFGKVTTNPGLGNSGYVGICFYDSVADKYYKPCFTPENRFWSDVVACESSSPPVEKELSGVNNFEVLAQYNPTAQKVEINVTLDKGQTLWDNAYMQYLCGYGISEFLSTALIYFANQ